MYPVMEVESFCLKDLQALLRQLSQKVETPVTSNGCILLGIQIDVRYENQEYPFSGEDGVNIQLSSCETSITFVLRYVNGVLQMCFRTPFIEESQDHHSIETAVQHILRGWQYHNDSLALQQLLK